MSKMNEELLEECVICMMKYENSNAYITPCKHEFCKTCITVISSRSYTISCPVCRNEFIPTAIYKWSGESKEEIYNRFKDALESKESQNLSLTTELINIVKFIISEKEGEPVLNYLLSNPELKPEFNYVYHENITKYFPNISDYYHKFTLALLFYKYH
jgi:transcription elongation factor Elf1